MSLHKEQKEQIFKEFGLAANDTGSTVVQIALLSKRVEELTVHMQTFRKDFSSKRGLLNVIAQRRRLLKYLERENQASYKDVIKRLNLKK
jgi:small subunit ribosomal protein S15